MHTWNPDAFARASRQCGKAQSFLTAIDPCQRLGTRRVAPRPVAIRARRRCHPVAGRVDEASRTAPHKCDQKRSHNCHTHTYICVSASRATRTRGPTSNGDKRRDGANQIHAEQCDDGDHNDERHNHQIVRKIACDGTNCASARIAVTVRWSARTREDSGGKILEVRVKQRRVKRQIDDICQVVHNGSGE